MFMIWDSKVFRSSVNASHWFKKNCLACGDFCVIPRWPYLLLSPCHVSGLFCIEWIGDAPHYKDIKLQLLFTLLFLPLQILHLLFFLLTGSRRTRTSWSGAAATAARRQSARALAGPAWRYAGSGLGCHHLLAFLLHYPIRFLLAGRWIQHLVPKEDEGNGLKLVDV